MRAAIYCRISQDKTGEAAGVTRQLEDCLALAEASGWTVGETHVYTDNDVSATSGKPRPEYRRLLDAIERGELDAVVAWAPDRLYRKLADLEELLEVMEGHNIAIKTCRLGDFDLSTPLGRMIARILGAVATGEVEQKSDRWERSVRQAREAGRWSRGGSRPFGWTDDGEVVEEEAETVRWLAGEVVRGTTLVSLCRDLNAQGVRTTRGNEWQAATLRNLLTNPRLAGYATLSKLVTERDPATGKKRKRRAPSEIVGRGTWTPILDDDTFETVRAVLTGRRTGTRAARVALLLGLIHCGRCEQPMVTGGRTSGTNRLRTYRCQAVPGRSEDSCGGLVVSALPVEEMVEAYAKVRLDDKRVRERVARIVASAGASDLAAEADALERRMMELEAQLSEPGLSANAILRALDRTKERLSEVQAELVQATMTRVALPTRGGGEWPDDLEQRRRLVALVVERVSIMPATKAGRFDPERVKIKRR